MTRGPRLLVFALAYAALSIAVASSLGVLLVPAVAEDFDVPVSTAQWMLTVNLLAGAAATPVMGRLVDGRYKRRMLLIALCIVAIGSIVAAGATEFWLFLVGRALQGLSLAIGPLTLAIARTQLPVRMVPRSIASLAITAATGLGLGYPLTGIIAGTLGFRFAFLFALAFVLSVIVVVLFAMPGGADATARPRRFDVTGAILFAAALTALILLLTEAPRRGWLSWQALALAALAVVLFTTWSLVELRVADPLIDIRLLRIPDVVVADVTTLLFGTMIFLCLSLSSVVAQLPVETGYGGGVPVLLAGFVILPFSVGTFLASRAFHLLHRLIGPLALLPLGGAFMTLSLLLLTTSHDQLTLLVVSILLCGVGAGVSFGALPLVISQRVPVDQIGSSLGLNAVMRTSGNASGAAIPAGILAATSLPGLVPSADGVRLTYLVGTLIGVAVTIATAAYAVARRGSGTR